LRSQSHRRYYQVKNHDLQRADRHIDLAQLAQLDVDSAREKSATSSTKSSPSRTGDVDRRAEQLLPISATILGYAASSLCWRATTSPTSWSTAPAAFIEVAQGSAHHIRFRDNAQLMNIASASSARFGRRSMKARRSAMRACRRSRVNVIAPPLSLMATLTIRKFRKDKLKSRISSLRLDHAEGARVLRIGACAAISSFPAYARQDHALELLTAYIDVDERVITCETLPNCNCSSPMSCARNAPPNLEGRPDHHARARTQLPAYASRSIIVAKCADPKRSTCCRP